MAFACWSALNRTPAQDFNHFSIMLYYIITITNQKIGYLFWSLISLNFKSVTGSKIQIAYWNRMRFLWLSKIKWTIQTRLHEVMKYETEKYVIFGVFSNSLKSPAICKAQCNFPNNSFLLGFFAPFYSFFKLIAKMQNYSRVNISAWI